MCVLRQQARPPSVFVHALNPGKALLNLKMFICLFILDLIWKPWEFPTYLGRGGGTMGGVPWRTGCGILRDAAGILWLVEFPGKRRDPTLVLKQSIHDRSHWAKSQVKTFRIKVPNVFFLNIDLMTEGIYYISIYWWPKLFCVYLLVPLRL